MAPTLDSPKLRELGRTQLQSLAKREVVRAVGKTEDIIRRLLHKHPKGVPVSEESENPSASSAPPKRNFFKKARKNTSSNSPIPDTPQAHTDPKGKGKAIADAASPSPSSSTEALELLYPEDDPVAGPSDEYPKSVSVSHAQVPAESEALPDRAPAQPPSFSGKQPSVLPSERSHGAYDEDEDAPHHGWRADEEDEEDVDEICNYVKGAPSHYMVVDALRQLTTLTNTIPVMETRIAESRCLLRRTEKLLEKATPDARELTVTREYLETVLFAKMKQKQELWDGTGRMEKTARKARMEWLRAQRKIEAEKKWAEASEFNRRHGHKPEPFSAFVLESDEEVIESLQTTPTSSRGGSSKRARVESADVESDADSGIGESQKKRACP